MSDIEEDLSDLPERPRHARPREHHAHENGNGSASRNGARNGSAPAHQFDFMALVEFLIHRWKWMLAGGVVMAAFGFLAGMALCKARYTATAELIRFDTPTTAELFQVTPITADTLATLLRAPELIQTVSAKVTPPISAERLAKISKVEPELESDIIKVSVPGPTPEAAMEAANLYAREAVTFARDLQAKQFAEMSQRYLKSQLDQLDRDLTILQEQFRNLPRGGLMTSKLTQIGTNIQAVSSQIDAAPRPSALTMKLSEKLQTALDELSTLATKYTEAHPMVQQQRSRIGSLQEQIQNAATNAPSAADAYGSLFIPGTDRINPMLEPDYEIIRTKLHALEEGRLQLANRVLQSQLFAENPPGNVRLFSSATKRTIKSNLRWVKITFFSFVMGFIGFVGTMGIVLLVELVDKRLKTAADVRRVTHLPLIATLGDLEKLDPAERSNWAFRTWTALQGRLSPSANHGLVCGITSSTPGEGRSTWINLLGEAASMMGFRVLTIATRPSPAHRKELEQTFEEPPEETEQPEPTNALTMNALNSPAEIADKLTGPNSQPMVHIPLPGWVWNLERRKQWQSALNHWRKIDNLVILVELPPARMQESVLLSSNLPNLIWLTDSGRAEAAETRSQLETLRHARCNLVGAVLNREPAPPLKRRFARWFNSIALFWLAGTVSVLAQQTMPPTTSPSFPSTAPIARPAPAHAANTVSPATDEPLVGQTNASFSVTGKEKRAAWQQRLTLGPGDVLNFSLFGSPELTRTEMTIGPDGRISFLEAQDILATGLTVDELRGRMDEALSQFRRSPRTVITPVLFKSKKYYMLGKVAKRGVYTLDRPITVLEAIARANGLELGLLDRNSIDLVDLQRSFLVRQGKRIPLNFEKMFLDGDLSQNIPLEPDDYLYFPSASAREVYVVGEVRIPGPVIYKENTTVISALSERSGFTDKAYKSRVLVLRGSLDAPQAFIVNTMAIMDGREKDFRLQPKDIVYVSYRPWSRVEDLLDMATTAFIQSVVTSWVGMDVLKP